MVRLNDGHSGIGGRETGNDYPRVLHSLLDVAVKLLGAIAEIFGEVAILDRSLHKSLNESLVPYGMTT